MRGLILSVAALVLAACYAPPTGPTPTTGPTVTPRPLPTSEAAPPIDERASWYTPTIPYGLPTPEPTAALRSVAYYRALDTKEDSRNGRLVLVVDGQPFWVSVTRRDHGEPTATLLRVTR